MLDFGRYARRSTRSDLPARGARLTTLDPIFPRRRHKADVSPEDPSRWEQTLVQFIEGRSLAQVLGFWAEGIPGVIGASGRESLFLSFLEGFRQSIPPLGIVTGSGPLGVVRSDQRPLQDNCGSTRKTVQRPAYDGPFRALRFNDLEAFFTDSITLQGALQDGKRDGLQPGSTIRGSSRSRCSKAGNVVKCGWTGSFYWPTKARRRRL